MSKLQSGTIGCNCGKCEITVADNRAVQYFLAVVKTVDKALNGDHLTKQLNPPSAQESQISCHTVTIFLLI